ncbi:MAG TPA: twin-arginine translocation signal domain-containing protein [Bacteroidetes bacterium]|nr:twin-arginine translocation signal domain-containing protein [Bacteroidota bacterium]
MSITRRKFIQTNAAAAIGIAAGSSGINLFKNRD